MRRIADISLLMVALIWGITFVMVQNAIAFLPPLIFNGVRFLLAALILYIIIFIKKGTSGFTKRTIINGTVLGFCLSIGYAFQTVGLLYTTVSKTGFITGLSVVLVPLLSFVFLKKLPAPATAAGSVAAAVGLYLLTASGESTFNFGDFLVLICAFGFAFHIVLTDIFTSQSSALALTAVQISVVSLLCFVSGLMLEDWKSTLTLNNLLNIEVFTALLVTALLATAAAFFIQTYAQKFTTPTRVALLLTMEPVFAAVTAYLWAGERLAASGAAGCLLIFLGMLLSEVPLPKRFIPKEIRR
ncbi:MAG TPA: DMT family transporter [Chondromyces sp.]|nr:DMT family transporter [Chondromyces sp.]